jgi:hypothetical protein
MGRWAGRDAQGELNVVPLSVDGSSYPVVRPLRVYLVRCSLDGQGPTQGAANPTAFVVDLALVRESAVELSVHMTVSTAREAPYAIAVTYGADFRLSEQVPESDREVVCRFTAYELAPPLLYPYIRELFADLTGRSLAPAITLPFLPVPLDLPPGEQEVPAPPSGSETGQAPEPGPGPPPTP